jgi:uncharacterized protein (TIGR00297 family)
MIDTLSSEIGQVLGRTPVVPTTGEIVPIGTDGAVSLEGTLVGVIGSALLAFMAYLFGAIPLAAVPLIMMAAFIGSSVESLLASWIQKDFSLKNELFNLINTAVGGAVGLFLASRLFLPA